MTNTFYFKHDLATREDDRISELIFKHGWSGYGIFWAIIEKLYQNDGLIAAEYERIAFALRTDAEIVRSICEDFSLFEKKNGALFSKRVRIELLARKTKSEKASDAAKSRWQKTDRGDANAMRTHSERNANIVEESIVKNNKTKKKTKKKTAIEIALDDFQEMRKKIRKPLTKKGLDLIVEKLEKFEPGNTERQIQILNQSIENSWQGVFELKESAKKENKPLTF